MSIPGWTRTPIGTFTSYPPPVPGCMQWRVFSPNWHGGCLQRGNFASLQDLVDTMHPYLEAHNRLSARPFRWRKDPEEIMAALKRGYYKLEIMH